MRSIVSPRLRLHVGRLAGGLSLGLALLAGQSGCTVQSIFACSTDQNCIDEGGEGGVCEANSQCTFPDETCENGKRWHARAVEELSEQCFDPVHVEGIDTDPAGSSGDDVAASDDTASPPTSDDGPPPATTTGMGGDTTAAPVSCDEAYGDAPGYELCSETEHSCVFNVLLEQSSCTALCESYGATCVGAQNNSAGDCASAEAEAPCDEMANDQICTCTK